MKRCLDDEDKKDQNIKKTNEEEIKELSNILNDIFEDDIIDIIIEIDTKYKKICINEKSDEKENNREYKYGNKNLSHLINSINDNFMYKNINSLLLYLNKQNLFVNKENWKNQLLNEIEYINILEEDTKREDELINLLESNLEGLKIR